MSRLIPSWHGLRASFWFIPALVVLASMAAAVVLIELDNWNTAELAQWSPRLFGASADGSRAMLSAIATSMITVAGVVFSITIVTLSLTSTQYSPRVLRNFMSDRPTQIVLGVFLGIFAYCMVVLRTIRGDEAGFIPSLAVLGGMAYALAGIALLIFFIHHIAQSIQASSIIDRITRETASAIDHLFPQELGDEPAAHAAEPALRWAPVVARTSGYVTSVDCERLVKVAAETGRVLRVVPAVGDFVAHGSVLIGSSGSEAVDDELADRLRGSILLGRQRTVEQDAGYGLQQLQDIALKALSPGINDPTTACMCVDRLGDLLGRLAARHMPGSHRWDEGTLRVVLPAPDFGRMLSMAIGPILQHSRGDIQVLQRLVDALAHVVACARDPVRHVAVGEMTGDLRRELRRASPSARRRHALARLRILEESLASANPG